MSSEERSNAQETTNEESSPLPQPEIPKKEGRFKCSACDERFTRESTLQEHEYLVHDIVRDNPIVEEEVVAETDEESEVDDENMSNDPFVSESKKYHCDLCDYSTNSKSALGAHRVVHTGEKPFSCTLCEMTFSYRQKFREHEKKVHWHEMPYSCSKCDKKFNKNEYTQYKEHELTHEDRYPFKCTRCSKMFAREASLIEHEKLHDNESAHCCTYCGKKFCKPSEARIHERIHTGEGLFKCDQCDMKYTKRKTLEEHYRSHTGETPFECEICGMKFSRIGNWRKHQRSHSDFKCSQCDMTFIKRRELYLHEFTHKELIQCPDCDYKCKRQYEFKQHYKRMHTDWQKESSFDCPHCDYKCPSSAALKQHLVIHSDERPFKCNLCDMSFKLMVYLTKHERTHTQERPYKCTGCDMRFNQPNSLRVHFKRRHTIKPGQTKTNHEIQQESWKHACFQCDRKFKHIGNLRRHEREDHGGENYTATGETLLSCSFGINGCHRKFTNSAELKEHERVHWEERPHHCPFCDMKFKKSSQCNRHVKRVHESDGVTLTLAQIDEQSANGKIFDENEPDESKPFRCGHCGQRFTTVAKLRKHNKLHTEEKPFSCTLCDSKFVQASNLKRHMYRQHQYNVTDTAIMDFETGETDYSQDIKIEVDEAEEFFPEEHQQYYGYEDESQVDVKPNIKIETAENIGDSDSYSNVHPKLEIGETY